MLTLALLVATVSAVRLGADRCTWGPSYWCTSVENAKECNTERHCRQKVWIGNHPLAKLTKPIPEDNNIPKPSGGQNCAICELVGKKIVSYMTDNETEADAIAEMEGWCKYLPSAEESSCESFMDNYGKDFYELLVNDMNVHDICSYLGMCSEEFLSIVREGKVLTSMMRNNYNGIGCDTCEAAVSLIQKEAKGNEKDIEALLDKLCGMLPVDEGECDGIVNTIYEEGLEYFESLTPKETCQLMGLCNAALYNMGIAPVKLGQVGQTVDNTVRDDKLGAGGKLGANFGTDKSCQNGPAFWCANEANAKLCHAEAYCQKNDAPIVF